MDIAKTRLLPKEHILLNLQSGDRDSVLNELVQPLVDSGIVGNKQTFIEDLIVREEQMTTIIEKNIAFPHARTRIVSNLGLVVGVVPQENRVNFLPNMPVQLFFLIAVPYISPASHLALLQFLAKFCKSKTRVQQLLRAKHPNVVVKSLSSFVIK